MRNKTICVLLMVYFLGTGLKAYDYQVEGRSLDRAVDYYAWLQECNAVRQRRNVGLMCAVSGPIIMILGALHPYENVRYICIGGGVLMFVVGLMGYFVWDERFRDLMEEGERKGYQFRDIIIYQW